jgi:hypothetical protein
MMLMIRPAKLGRPRVDKIDLVIRSAKLILWHCSHESKRETTMEHREPQATALSNGYFESLLSSAKAREYERTKKGVPWVPRRQSQRCFQRTAKVRRESRAGDLTAKLNRNIVGENCGAERGT